MRLTKGIERWYVRARLGRTLQWIAGLLLRARLSLPAALCWPTADLLPGVHFLRKTFPPQSHALKLTVREASSVVDSLPTVI